MNDSAQHKGNKLYRTGTHRAVSPEETLARAKPWFGKLGITRVSNITGLDRLGIPVAMAVRPNSRSISVSQGKGVELSAAKASAVMESVETWHAEHVGLPLLFGSAAELEADGRVLADLDELPRAGAGRFDSHVPIFWIESGNLLDDTRAWVPFEMVSTNYTLPLPPGSGHFAADTNGLASGNTFEEAACHGVFEVVERDAESLWRHSPVREQDARGVDVESVDDPVCRSLLDRFADAGVTVRIWDVTSDARIACFVCLAIGDASDWADPEFGAGCHAAREVALARALTEAAQARTTFIAGSRDDIGAAPYLDASRRRRREHCAALSARHRPSQRFEDAPGFDNATIAGDLGESLERLRAIGVRQVLAVDLEKPDIGLPVVKVIVPSLEGAHGHHGQTGVAGRRARAARKLPAELAALVT